MLLSVGGARLMNKFVGEDYGLQHGTALEAALQPGASWPLPDPALRPGQAPAATAAAPPPSPPPRAPPARAPPPSPNATAASTPTDQPPPRRTPPPQQQWQPPAASALDAAAQRAAKAPWGGGGQQQANAGPAVAQPPPAPALSPPPPAAPAASDQDADEGGLLGMSSMDAKASRASMSLTAPSQAALERDEAAAAFEAAAYKPAAAAAAPPKRSMASMLFQYEDGTAAPPMPADADFEAREAAAAATLLQRHTRGILGRTRVAGLQVFAAAETPPPQQRPSAASPNAQPAAAVGGDPDASFFGVSLPAPENGGAARSLRARDEATASSGGPDLDHFESSGPALDWDDNSEYEDEYPVTPLPDEEAPTTPAAGDEAEAMPVRWTRGGRADLANDDADEPEWKRALHAKLANIKLQSAALDESAKKRMREIDERIHEDDVAWRAYQ